MTEKGLSVIVIAYNEEKYIRETLASLAEQTCRDFELIVVDSNSSDNTGPVAQGFSPHFREFKYHRLQAAHGPAHSRNQGAKLARYERLLFLDSDTRLGRDFIERAVRELEARNIHVATCRLRIAESDRLAGAGARLMNLLMRTFRPFYSSGYGACFFTTKGVHDVLRGFDENLAICEDCNYIHRARRLHSFRYGILRPVFYASNRRAVSEGSLGFLAKYARIHFCRMVLRKEFRKGAIEYTFGAF